MGNQVPIVDYLVLDDGAPHLVANRCDTCGALYFDRRNACAKCSGRSFSTERLADDGKVRSYTIVHRAAPGVPTPYVSAIVDLTGGGVVKANLLNVRHGRPPNDRGRRRRRRGHRGGPVRLRAGLTKRRSTRWLSATSGSWARR